MNFRTDIFVKKLMQFIPKAALVKINFLLINSEKNFLILNILKKKKNHFSKFAKNSYFASIINFTSPISLERYNKIKNHMHFAISFKEDFLSNFTIDSYFTFESHFAMAKRKLF